jgi:hypothetical protein
MKSIQRIQKRLFQAHYGSMQIKEADRKADQPRLIANKMILSFVANPKARRAG